MSVTNLASRASSQKAGALMSVTNLAFRTSQYLYFFNSSVAYNHSMLSFTPTVFVSWFRHVTHGRFLTVWFVFVDFIC